MYFCAVFGSVAELNRASDSGSEGRGFESHPGHKKSLVIIRFPRIFCLCDFKEKE